MSKAHIPIYAFGVVQRGDHAPRTHARLERTPNARTRPAAREYLLKAPEPHDGSPHHGGTRLPRLASDNPTRARIRRYIAQRPGAHLRGIARACGLALGTTIHHLAALERGGVITTRRDGRYKRYFVADAWGREEKAILSALHRDVPRALLRDLAQAGPATQRELRQRIGLSRSTTSFHLAQLVEQGLVRAEGDRLPRRYAIVDAEAATRLLTRARAA